VFNLNYYEIVGILNDKNEEMEFKGATFSISILIDNVIFKQMIQLSYRIKLFVL